MTIAEIKHAIDNGKVVQWASPTYRVIKDIKGQYLITCLLNCFCWGLTNQAGTRLNGDPAEFSIILEQSITI